MHRNCVSQKKVLRGKTRPVSSVGYIRVKQSKSKRYIYNILLTLINFVLSFLNNSNGSNNNKGVKETTTKREDARTTSIQS